MKQVELADRQQQDAGANIEWFVHEIIDMGEFESDFQALRRIFTNSVLDLNFRREFDVLSNVRIDEWDKTLLIKRVARAAVSILDSAHLFRSILNIHIATDDRLRSRDKRFRIDQPS